MLVVWLHCAVHTSTYIFRVIFGPFCWTSVLTSGDENNDVMTYNGNVLQIG